MFAALFQGSDSWFDASSYEVDGVTSKVGAFVDRRDATHKLVQATSASQVDVPTTEVTMGGALAASFLAAQGYQSNRGAAAWRFLHDATGSTALHVWLPQAEAGSRMIVSTMNGATNGPGAMHYTGASTGFNWWAGNAANAAGGILSGNGGARFVNGTASYAVYRLGSGSSPQYHGQAKSTTAVSGSLTNTPNTGDPTASLVLGRDTAGNLGKTMRWRMSCFWNRYLTDSDVAVVRSYVQSQLGIAP